MSDFVSTTIPYVNGAPHIGHAQEFVITDTLARYRRQRGSVHLQSGSDENSLKNVIAAEAIDEPTAVLVAHHAANFEHLAATLGLECDAFVRTSTDADHRATVEALWSACDARGDITKADYIGRYCVGCEQFYRDNELDDGRCPEHLTVPEEIREVNYFFRLDRYQQALIEAIESGQLRIEPPAKRNEILGFLREPLEPLSISRDAARSRGWGIPVPGDESQVIYVWFDALVNYVAGPSREAWEQFDRVSHVVGKGVSRFHAVYWPAMLLSAGWRLPDEILVHNYVTVDGQKIGKSLGNAVSPFDVIARHGVDAFRYYLLRHVGCFRDGDFTYERFDAVYDADLANQLGNLVARLCGLARGITLPGASSSPGFAEALNRGIDDAVISFALHRAVERIWDAIETINRGLSQSEPWRRKPAEKASIVATALADLTTIAKALEPFLPDTARRIQASIAPDGLATKQPPLFPRIDKNRERPCVA